MTKTKRPSLAESMKSVQPQAAPRVIEVAPAAVSRPEGKGYFAATRQDKKRITYPASSDEHRRMKLLSANTGITMEELMGEAIRDLLAKHGG